VAGTSLRVEEEVVATPRAAVEDTRPEVVADIPPAAIAKELDFVGNDFATS
jgi:hypothetical protein